MFKMEKLNRAIQLLWFDDCEFFFMSGSARWNVSSSKFVKNFSKGP